MKKNQLYVVALAFGFLLSLSSCSNEDIFTPQEEVESNVTFSKSGARTTSTVSGQGGLSFGEGTKTQHFSFHASLDRDGNVSGSFESKSPSQSIRSHGTIDCITFLDDKTAILSGTITKIGGENNYVVGTSIWFKVIDNGEGSKNGTDQFSDYYIGAGGCYPYNVRMRNIESGNIQIKR